MRRSRFRSGNSENSRSLNESEGETEWEIRPGGMLVQKRAAKSDISAPDFCLRVACGDLRYDIPINSQATFGELKKALAAETGLEPCEQRLMFRGKERGNDDYLDLCGVKDRAKIVVVEDPLSRERRFVEMRRNAKIESARRAISDISMEVDNLADQVSAIEKSVSNGSTVPEVQITTLIETLMRQAIKLDAISTEGDASAQKNLQAKRVQECVEALDVLKISNARLKHVIVTTKWETFDSPVSTQWGFFN